MQPRKFRTPTRRALLCLAAIAVLALHIDDAPAQGFDPGKVDWEALSKIPMKDGFIKQFNDQCAACHGEDLRGTPLGTPLVGRELRYGASVQDIARSIGAGFPDKGMPAWSETLKATQIWNLALYVAEQRQGTTILDKRADIPLAEKYRQVMEAYRIEIEYGRKIDTYKDTIAVAGEPREGSVASRNCCFSASTSRNAAARRALPALTRPLRSRITCSAQPGLSVSRRRKTSPAMRSARTAPFARTVVPRGALVMTPISPISELLPSTPMTNSPAGVLPMISTSPSMMT